MDRYDYNKTEKEINKVLKMHEQTLNEVKTERKVLRNKLDISIAGSESILASLNKKVDSSIIANIRKEKSCSNIRNKSWEKIVAESEKSVFGEVKIEDILSHEEIEISLNELEEIKNKFSKITKLDKKDIAFLAIATAMQTLRWILMPKIGETIDKNSRLNHDDKTIKEDIKNKNKAYQKTHEDKEHNKLSKGYKTWEEIIFNSVPYDATKGAIKFGENMEGGYHRYKTLGHDPILCWIFGTANIITDTITLNNFNSYRVQKMEFAEKIILSTVFEEMIDSITEDKNRLLAAIFAQGVHLSSDKFTKLGLPIPIIEVFSEKLAGKLYHAQYDAICFEKDLKKISASATISILINTIIGIVHNLFYDEKTDFSRELYEVRTKKILLLSNSIATTSNIIACAILKNPKLLDIGGLVVTISRLFSDTRFILKIQEEFISNELNEKLQLEINNIDLLYEKIVIQNRIPTAST